MTRHAIEITVGDVTDMEARVYARHSPALGDEVQEQKSVVLRGTLRGPFCEFAHTLPAEFVFRDLGPGPPASAEAVVTDPCLWSPALPHLYQADVEALRDGQVVAEYHGMIGLRRTPSSRSDGTNP
jgi:Glycosyl hydrolases family 2